MSDKDWKNFVDEGEVGIELLEGIAVKIKYQIEISDREVSVYQAYGEKIEQLLLFKIL
tara:strand:+ start:452 stop:625 length:174 start_codon:yes stop_codon:yes gene_type:complete